MNETIENWEKTESVEIVLKVRKAQIEQLYRQTRTGLIGVMIVTLSVCLVLWNVIPQWKLIAWTSTSVALILIRGVITAAFHRRSPSGPAIYLWAKLHVIGVTSSGLLWAVTSFFMWPENSPLHQLILPICILSLSSVAVATYCTWTQSYISFLFLTKVPLSLRLLTEGDVVHVILGLLAIIFIAILAQTGKIMHTASLQSLVVGIRNEALSSILTEEKTIQEELNVHLQQEIEVRTRSQEELQLQNQALERLNTQLTITKNNLESANQELALAMKNVKQLSGMLPICASCKSIRNDKGYWEQIEEYVREHTEAQFSHGICPGCMAKLYPAYCKKIDVSEE